MLGNVLQNYQEIRENIFKSEPSWFSKYTTNTNHILEMQYRDLTDLTNSKLLNRIKTLT